MNLLLNKNDIFKYLWLIQFVILKLVSYEYSLIKNSIWNIIDYRNRRLILELKFSYYMYLENSLQLIKTFTIIIHIAKKDKTLKCCYKTNMI